jgi:hypothetical protein
MKLEIYEPHKIGYVIKEPYEWEYNGRYPAVSRFLSNNHDFYKSKAYREDGEIVEDEKLIVDEEDYYDQVSSGLKKLGVWHTKVVEE